MRRYLESGYSIVNIWRPVINSVSGTNFIRWTLQPLTCRTGLSGCQENTLVMDNLNTHTGASLYKALEPEIARRPMEKLEFVYTPKHGSWLNMAECEFSVLSRQCLNRRLADMETVCKEVDAWTATRNRSAATVKWRFTTEDTRIKLKQLYLAMSN